MSTCVQNMVNISTQMSWSVPKSLHEWYEKLIFLLKHIFIQNEKKINVHLSFIHIYESMSL